MRIYKAKDYKEMSRIGANILSSQIILKPQSVLGLATGSTPLGIYELLIERCKGGDIDFSQAASINLDEYKGLDGSHSQSYRYFMQNNLFSSININLENTHVPNGLADDDSKECRRYDKIIDDCGGIDIQLLGLGHNGHIGFNEPGTDFPKGTHLVALAESTIKANKRFFADEKDVPRFAYTMGIKSIMKARHILIAVSGIDKADIVKIAFWGPVSPEVPASVLQLHNNVTLIADEAALSKVD